MLPGPRALLTTTSGCIGNWERRVGISKGDLHFPPRWSSSHARSLCWDSRVFLVNSSFILSVSRFAPVTGLVLNSTFLTVAESAWSKLFSVTLCFGKVFGPTGEGVFGLPFLITPDLSKVPGSPVCSGWDSSSSFLLFQGLASVTSADGAFCRRPLERTSLCSSQ